MATKTTGKGKYIAKITNRLSDSDKYNLQVDDYLESNNLSPIEVHSIRLFQQNARENNISVAAYNKAVEEHNAQHGFMIKKKQCNNYTTAAAPKKDTSYNYINYPMLSTDAYKKSMDQYRFYVFSYNESLIALNKSVQQTNGQVIINATEEQKEFAKTFKKKNNHLFTKDYNEKAQEHNTTYGHIIKLKRYQSIKYSSEMIMDVLLGFYASQLRDHNAYRLNLGQSTRISKSKPYMLRIDQNKLANHKKNNFQRLVLCKKTAQNHIKRLREAGILINYKFVNQNTPIRVHINPQIIAILDGKPPKHQLTPNQTVIPENLKKLHDNSDTTRTRILKEEKIKDIADSNDNLKERSCILAEGLQEHEENRNTRNGKQEKNNERKRFRASKNLKQTLLEPDELAEALANHEFDTYKGIRYEKFVKEYQYGNLDIIQLRQVIVQDFIKSSAKIWKNHNVYEGEWRKTINYLESNFLKTFARKESLINQISQLRWRIDFARRWFLKTERSTKKQAVKALYPSSYFDFTRKTTKEIGFAGTFSFWKTHIKNLDQENRQDKQRVLDAQARKRRLSQQEKLQKKVKQLLDGKCTKDELFNYVSTNLHHDMLSQIPFIIQKLETTHG